jgi:hypothetical protein
MVCPMLTSSWQSCATSLGVLGFGVLWFRVLGFRVWCGSVRRLKIWIDQLIAKLRGKDKSFRSRTSLSARSSSNDPHLHLNPQTETLNPKSLTLNPKPQPNPCDVVLRVRTHRQRPLLDVLLSLHQVGVLGLVLWSRLYDILEEEDAKGSQSIPAPPMPRGSVLGFEVRQARDFGVCELSLRRRGN